MALEVLLRGMVSRAQPQAIGDQTRGVQRMARYGEGYVIPLIRKQHALADEGSYFIANNAQTGVAATALGAFTAVSPFLYLLNTDSPTNSNAKRLHLDYINLTTTAAAGAASTGLVLACAVVLDGPARVITTTPTSLVPQNVNMDVPKSTSVAQVGAGALVLGAATAQVRTVVGARVLRMAVSATAAELIWESRYLNFGGTESPSMAGLNGSTGALEVNAQSIALALPPVTIGPGQMAIVYLWFQGATTPTAGSYIPELGWWER